MSDFTNVHDSLLDEGVDDEHPNGSDPFRDAEDTQNPNYYCEHGTFIGNPFGGDYLCGWCEDGISLADFQAYCERQRHDLFMRNLSATMMDGLNPGLTIPTGWVRLTVAIYLAIYKGGA